MRRLEKNVINMANKENRALKILELLKQYETMQVSDLARMLNVSEMTVRRDLKLLQKTNELERGYGYAKMPHKHSARLQGTAPEPYDIRLEQVKFNEEKERIARCAAELIQPQDVVILDSGTTVRRVAWYIPENAGITVLCYNFIILTELCKRSDVNIIFSGGNYYPEDQLFRSAESGDFIRSHRANKVFLAASGFHPTLGITCIHSHEVELKRADIDSSATRILLITSNKFGMVKNSYVTEPTNIDILITDSGITKEWRKIVTDMGIDLRIV